MAQQLIKRFTKFPEVPGLDKELNLIIKQIQAQIGLMDPALGELYIDGEPAVSLTVTTPGTYYPLIGYKFGEKNKVELTSSGFRLQEKGLYHAIVSTSFTCDVNNTIVHAAIFANDVIFKKLQMERKIGTAADFGAMPMNGFGRSSLTDFVQLRFTADKACDITFNHLNLTIDQRLT